MLALLDKADESGYLTMEDILEAYQPLDDSPDEARENCTLTCDGKALRSSSMMMMPKTLKQKQIIQ